MDKVVSKMWEPTEGDKSFFFCTLCPRYCGLELDKQASCYDKDRTLTETLFNWLWQTNRIALIQSKKNHLIIFFPANNLSLVQQAAPRMQVLPELVNEQSKTRWSQFTWKLRLKCGHLAKRYDTHPLRLRTTNPTIFGEYVIDISKIAREEGIKIRNGDCRIYW